MPADRASHIRMLSHRCAGCQDQASSCKALQRPRWHAWLCAWPWPEVCRLGDHSLLLLLLEVCHA